MRKIGFICFVLVLFSSCVMEKRLYNKGFYIQRNTLKIADEPTGTLKPEQARTQTESIPHFNLEADSIFSYTTTENDTLVHTEFCDTILFLNGDTLFGNVIIINDRWIAFDDCENVKVKKPSFNRSRIHAIHFSNGEIKVFHPLNQQQKEVIAKRKSATYKSESNQKLFRLSVYLLLASIFVLGLTLLINSIQDLVIIALILAIPALVFGVLASIFYFKTSDRKMKLFSIIIAGLALIAAAFAYHFTSIFTDFL